MIVSLNAEAETDLGEIGDWIARDAPRRAYSYVLELRAACDGLAANPERFERVGAARTDRLHRRVHGRHVIYYVVSDEAVTVVRILDGSRDVRRIFDLP